MSVQKVPVDRVSNPGPSPSLPPFTLLPSILPVITRARRPSRTSALAVHRSQAQASLTCPHCATIFASTPSTSAAALRSVHVKIAHIKHFACGKCPSSFSRKFDLEKHVLTVHDGSRPWACTLCENAFGQKHHLSRHIGAVHAKDKKFSCETCATSFSRSEHLRSHKASVHAMDRAYACVLCAVRYVDKHRLVKHIVALHKVTPERAAVLAAIRGNDVDRMASLLGA